MTTTSQEKGLVFAYEIIGDGSGRPLNWDSIREGWEKKGLFWLHLNYENPETKTWLETESHIDESLIPYLLSDDSRPGVFVHEDHLLMSMRGINFNANEEPEDLVSIRFYISPDQLITLRRRKVHILEDISRELLNGKGVRNASQFIYEVFSRVIGKIGDHTETLDIRVAKLEQMLITSPGTDIGDKLQEIQSELIDLRRYLSPQKLMFAQLLEEELDWVDYKMHNKIRTQAELHTRYVEDIEYCWQRTQVIKDELNSRQSEQLNQKLYLLAVVSCVFLPLTLITGLLGVNLAGIPYAANPKSFAVLTGAMVVMALGILAFFKKKKWF